MYFEFDPNFTSEVIQKNIRLQFEAKFSMISMDIFDQQ